MAKNGTEGVERYRADLAAAWRNLAGTDRVPLTLGVYARCMCRGANYSDGGRCKACGAFPVADWEWDLLTGNVNGFQECTEYADAAYPCPKCGTQNEVHNPGGFMESDTEPFPVTLTLYRGTKPIVIQNVREDSITVKESTLSGYVNVEYENCGNDTLGYVPMVDYYTTDTN